MASWILAPLTGSDTCFSVCGILFRDLLVTFCGLNTYTWSKGHGTSLPLMTHLIVYSDCRMKCPFIIEPCILHVLHTNVHTPSLLIIYNCYVYGNWYKVLSVALSMTGCCTLWPLKYMYMTKSLWYLNRSHSAWWGKFIWPSMLTSIGIPPTCINKFFL